MIFKLRVILDASEDIFRDIEIEEEHHLEELHNAITQAFGFDGGEMASFYVADEEWEQGEEISLFDMSESGTDIRLMNETPIDDVLNEENPHLIYVYDFLNMWTFFVELREIDEKENGKLYPNLLFAHGILPDSPPEKKFEAVPGDSPQPMDPDDMDIEDYDNLDFDENWN
ncbi:IS1096 element passenger TnpR family protein [Ascidiimonas sp. W6]|uniref:IS1096 element passenger TnpR family protein n=1 Tax=Ascidiimonas meishanensis TaxID=3128903 RepID=UPI0030EDD304